MYDPNALKIYIDGSAPEANPGGPCGFGIIVEFPDSLNRVRKEIRKGYRASTNNRMELMAFLEALGWISKNSRGIPMSEALIITDSMYVNDGHRNVPYWQTKKWVSQSGTPIENVDLWKKYISIRRNIRVRLLVKWTTGKSTEVLRDVDRLAKNAAISPTNIDFGYQPGRISRTKTGGGGAAVLFPARGQTEIARFYGGRIAGKEYYKIKFEVFSVGEQSYMQKYCAYIPKEWRHDIHRNHCYEFRFNSNLRLPKVEEFKPIEQCP